MVEDERAAMNVLGTMSRSGGRHAAPDASQSSGRSTLVSRRCDGCHSMIAFRSAPKVVGAVGTCEACHRTYRLAGGVLSEIPVVVYPRSLRHVS